MKASRTQFGMVVTASKKLVAGIFAAAALSLAAAAAEGSSAGTVPCEFSLQLLESVLQIQKPTAGELLVLS
ncbi:MAG: hypothetical protein IKL96_12390 [Kiritimatiellae bacterium]|nr:hypothetical protein [Kiritimatiellia bacterium]